MSARSERREEEVYAQAVKRLHAAGPVIAHALAEAPTGLVVVLDIAGMACVNSRHGSTTGDRLLRAVELSLSSSLSGAGHVARLAGDQFLVVIPGSASEDATGLILRAVKRARVRGRWGQPVRVTASIGAAAWHDEVSRHTVVSAAGNALRGRTDYDRYVWRA